jgi:hypothetical protein
MDKVSSLLLIQIPYWRDSLAECIPRFNGEKMEIVNSVCSIVVTDIDWCIFYFRGYRSFFNFGKLLASVCEIGVIRILTFVLPFPLLHLVFYWLLNSKKSTLKKRSLDLLYG